MRQRSSGGTASKKVEPGFYELSDYEGRRVEAVVREDVMKPSGYEDANN